MVSVSREKEPNLQLIFGAVARTYEESMDGLVRIAHQIELIDREPDEVLSHLTALYETLAFSTPEDFYEERLVPLTDEDVRVLAAPGSFRLLGKPPLLEPIATIKASKICMDTPFYGFFDFYGNLTTWDLYPEGDEAKPGMHLVAVRCDAAKDEFPWNIGWVTEEEFRSLAPDNSSKG